MNDWPYDSRHRRDGVTIPTIWVAIALSLLMHGAVLWEWLPRLRLPSLETPEKGDARGSLVVRLTPPPRPPTPPPSPATQPQQPPPEAGQREPRPPAATVRPRRAPPVIALNRPAPDPTASPPATPSVSAPARFPADGDLASYVEERRRARAESAPSTPQDSVAEAPPNDDENARANRIATGNLASQRALSFGYDPTRGGGIFQIMRLGYDNAEFLFFGWDKEIRRNTKQLIEVRRGSNSDIRIAVVRRMIAIIREHEQGDFVWQSKRLARNVSLSARQRDNAGLEEFIMQEFFEDARRPQ